MARQSGAFIGQRNEHSPPVFRIFLPNDDASFLKGSNGMGHIPGVQCSLYPECDLAQLASMGQCRDASILIAVHARRRELPMQYLM